MPATLCDLAVGYAVRAQADDDISGAATVSLTTDYMAPARPGAWLEARARVEKLGSRLAFADCAVTADGREVVRARAVFSVLDPSEPPPETFVYAALQLRDLRVQ